MKISIEFNPVELKTAISNGTLIALAEMSMQLEAKGSAEASGVPSQQQVNPPAAQPLQMIPETPLQTQPTYIPQQPAPVYAQPPVQQPGMAPFQPQYPGITGTPAPSPAYAPPAATPVASVPTSAPTYTMDQLAVAATQLVDAGRRAEVVALNASFGAQSLMQIPKEQYGAYATQLRAMGAKI